MDRIRVRAITSRVVAAALGGYVVANVGAIALAPWLPGSRADALMGAILMSYLIFVAAIIWVFAAKSALTAWVGIGAALVLALGSIALVGTGAGA